MNLRRDNTRICIKQQIARATADGVRHLALAAIVCLLLVLTATAYPETSSAKYKEYEVKAAFIYNFLKFVDWPEDKMAKDSNEVIIGIIGEDPFGPAADIFKGKTIEDRKLVVKRFEGIEQINKMAEKDKNDRLEAVRNCHLLFICSSEQKQTREITDIVDKHAVLTVGDNDPFIESGGIINLFIEENKIRFDINLAASKKAGLEMRSQLVRLARKVTKDDADTTAPKNNLGKKEGS